MGSKAGEDLIWLVEMDGNVGAIEEWVEEFGHVERAVGHSDGPDEQVMQIKRTLGLFDIFWGSLWEFLE